MTARERMMRNIAFIIAILFSSTALGVPPETRIISLDRIWAYEMPGTQNIRKLEPKHPTGNLSNEEFIRRSRIMQIYEALGKRPKEGEKAGPAIVVVGTGKEALENAFSAFIAKEKKEPPRLMPVNSSLSLFFYAYIGGRHVRIVSVGVSGRLVTIQYQLVAHSTAESTAHFALIPLEKLPKGVVKVTIEQVPPIDEKGRALPLRDERHIVCDSFSFAVK